jgi:hypothetical protein
LVYGALVYHLYRLTLSITALSRGPVALAVLMIAMSPPVIVYSTQIFPELVAALLAVIALRALINDAPSWLRWGGAAAVASLLPWFGLRYGLLTAALLAIIGASALRPSTKNLRYRLLPLLPAAGAVAVIGGSLLAFNLELYGSPVPPQDLESAEFNYYRPVNLYLYGVGGVVGTPSGLIQHAPLLLLALLAVPVATPIVKRHRMLAGATLPAAYLGFSAYFGSPGYAPPGRYFVSVVPLLAIPLAVGLRFGGRFLHLAALFLGALTLLAITTSAQNFKLLYTLRMETLQPIGATREFYPYVIDDYRPKGISLPADKIPHDVGRLESGDGGPVLLARSPRDPPGFLAYGPYETLQPGRYVARFTLWGGKSESGRTLGGVEVIEVGGRVIAARPIKDLPAGDTLIGVPFATDGGIDLELRVHFADGVLGVRSVEAMLVELFPTRRTSQEWWKSLVWIGVGGSLAVLWARRPSIASGE